MFNDSTNLWYSEPPQWPPIRGELSSTSHNLHQYLSCDRVVDNPALGTLYSLNDFISFCQSIENETETSRDIKPTEAVKERNLMK